MKRLLLIIAVTSGLCVPTYYATVYGYTSIYATGYQGGYDDASRIVPAFYVQGLKDGYAAGIKAASQEAE